MKINRLSAAILPFALAGLLLAGGCKKQDNQANNAAQQPAPAAQPAPATSPSTGAPVTPPTTSSSSGTPTAAPSGSTAAAPAPTPAPAAAPTPPPPPPPIVIPAGTHLAVTTTQALGSKISVPGDSFSATVAQPVVVNGVRVIPAGARATGTVVDAKALGKFKGGATLSLRLDSVRAHGTTYQIASSTIERAEKGKGKRSAGFIGGGAGGGALIGGLAGGGKGALIGGLIGAGAGTAGAAFTGNKDIVIPAETTLTFRLEHSLTVPNPKASKEAEEEAPPAQ
ncbi:MAG: hypothetical protein JOZ33_03145 [Acidobacteriaceae bacterium]|nr:hypothetical protein [Acidobacteriaceae bacterium]